MRIPTLFTLNIIAAALIFNAPAAKAGSIFDNYTLEGHNGHYLVKKDDVNVREKPSNEGKRITKLDRRDIVDVLGLAKGTQWAATQQDGKDLGFVYAYSLTPLIDASFDDELSGEVNLEEQDKPTCSYRLSYEGRYMEEEVVFISSDYLAHFSCTFKDNSFKFNAMMFMSEVPHDLGIKPVYQITMNLPDVATGYEEFLSATVLYHQLDNKVVMDAVSLKEFKEANLQKSLEAKEVSDAVQQAIILQLQSFNHRAWRTIAGDIPAPGQIEKTD